MSVTDSPLNKRNGNHSILIAEGFLVDADSNLRYNTHINNAIGHKMFAQYSTVIKRVMLSDMRVGSRVIVRDNFGNGRPREVTVVGLDEDIKNGRPGIDYDDSWAYLTQVDRVVKY
jgi:hypothetical protein